MSINYSVIPYDDVFTQSSVIDWLKDTQTDIPSNLSHGRNPTPNELRNVLDNLENCQVDYYVTSATWQAEINCENDNTSINVLFSGNEDAPFDLSFSGGDTIVIRILEELAKVCGTLILLYDGENPTFIIPTLP